MSRRRIEADALAGDTEARRFLAQSDQALRLQLKELAASIRRFAGRHGVTRDWQTVLDLTHPRERRVAAARRLARTKANTLPAVARQQWSVHLVADEILLVADAAAEPQARFAIRQSGGRTDIHYDERPEEAVPVVGYRSFLDKAVTVQVRSRLAALTHAMREAAGRRPDNPEQTEREIRAAIAVTRSSSRKVPTQQMVADRLGIQVRALQYQLRRIGKSWDDMLDR